MVPNEGEGQFQGAMQSLKDLSMTNVTATSWGAHGLMLKSQYDLTCKDYIE